MKEHKITGQSPDFLLNEKVTTAASRWCDKPQEWGEILQASSKVKGVEKTPTRSSSSVYMEHCIPITLKVQSE